MNTQTFYVTRLFRNSEETIGIFSTEGKIICHSLEDEKRTIKVFGETRIPAGTYNVTLRTEGGHHKRYKKMFSFHRGMLHIRDVPNFKWILIHIGNNEDDTAGCILPGIDAHIGTQNRYRILSSTIAYKRLYKLMSKPLLRGDQVLLNIRDECNEDIYGWKPVVI